MQRETSPSPAMPVQVLCRASLPQELTGGLKFPPAVQNKTELCPRGDVGSGAAACTHLWQPRTSTGIALQLEQPLSATRVELGTG